MLAPLHVLFVDHDLSDEQPQQLRCQLLDVCVPLCQGDKVVCAGHLLPQPLNGSFLFWDGLIQRFHLLGVAAGERLELLRCDPPQDAVLIKALEDTVQLLTPLLHSGQFPFQPTHLFSDLRRLSAADVCGKLLGVLPGHCCHPPQILQNHVIQHTLPDIVGGAEGAVLLVSPAGEVVVGPAHGMGTVEYHGTPAVGAHHQPGVLVLLVHLGRSPFVLAYPLDDIPDLTAHQGGVGIFQHHALFSGMFNFPLVLVGTGAVPEVNGVAQVNLILQHVGNRTVGPPIGIIQIQTAMGNAKGFVSVGRRA